MESGADVTIVMQQTKELCFA